MLLADILTLEPHGPDTLVGSGPRYPWGGLYGGQIVAQSLIAAGTTVDDEFAVHSLRAYFIRRGDQDEPIRFEVDRIRNGSSFCTRRVVARQATGAILNLEASFQRSEPSQSLLGAVFPSGTPSPDDLTGGSWTPTFDRRSVPFNRDTPIEQRHARAWFAVNGDLATPLHQGAALAFISDDLPTEAVMVAHPLGALPEAERWRYAFSASLDHSIWFHRPVRADRWHLHDVRCTVFSNSRGLTIGQVFDETGAHVATFTQEVLLRDGRDRGDRGTDG